jgi:hypothetical protein
VSRRAWTSRAFLRCHRASIWQTNGVSGEVSRSRRGGCCHRRARRVQLVGGAPLGVDKPSHSGYAGQLQPAVRHLGARERQGAHRRSKRRQLSGHGGQHPGAHGRAEESGTGGHQRRPLSTARLRRSERILGRPADACECRCGQQGLVIERACGDEGCAEDYAKSDHRTQTNPTVNRRPYGAGACRANQDVRGASLVQSDCDVAPAHGRQPEQLYACSQANATITLALCCPLMLARRESERQPNDS